MVGGVVSFVAFDALFEIFHPIFFAGGSYTFDPATERLVQLFPFQFWQETAIVVGAVCIVVAAIVAVVADERARASRDDAAEDAAPRRTADDLGAPATGPIAMNAVPIARLFGFEIRVHVSWAIILAVIGVTAATQVAESAPDVGGPGSWLVGAVVAAAFLFSALAHELGHAIAARRAGLPGGPVIVYFFGGAASSRLETARPRDEIVIAARRAARQPRRGRRLLGRRGLVGELGRAAGSRRPGASRSSSARMNLLLGGVNLLPAFPLDGGRIVRGLAWARTGDPARALRIAASGRAVPRDPVRDARHRRDPARGLARRADARGLRLVHRLERRARSNAAPTSTRCSRASASPTSWTTTCPACRRA